MGPTGGNAADSRVEIGPAVDRRHHARHALPAPAYARVNGELTGQVPDLSEILNISEQGVSIQLPRAALENQELNLWLDLPESETSICVSGPVVWSDPSGRTGIYLETMSGSSRRQLRNWLLHGSRGGARASFPVTAEESDEIAVEEPAAETDYTAMLTALSAVRREVSALGPDLDSALQLIARRSQVFTHANGAAIALAEGEEIVCRASAGPAAPPLGARLIVGSGFSGECVRTGSLLRCDDSEVDSRADRESCRQLGVRSMIAVPIFRNGTAVGLLEVFSPEAGAFSGNDSFVLQQLATLVPSAIDHASSAMQQREMPPAAVDDEFPIEPPAYEGLLSSSHSGFRKVLLTTIAATLVLVALWLVVPGGAIRSFGSGHGYSTRPPEVRPSLSRVASVQGAGNVQDVRRLAEQGDTAAQFAMGARFATGEDVPQDYAEAVRWFSLAAEQGHVAAQATLGAYYWAGRGVEQDLTRAYFWSALALAGGDQASRYRVTVLASRLNRSQVAAAQQHANDWIRQHQLASKASTESR